MSAVTIEAIPPAPDATFSAIHCTLEIHRPHPGVIVAVFKGHDIGEFGDAPFRELDRDVASGAPLEVFVDARAVRSASIEVSGEWARWMMMYRDRIYRFHILCRSPFIELTAGFVQRFTEFGPRMRIHTDATAFDEAVRTACGPSASA